MMAEARNLLQAKEAAAAASAALTAAAGTAMAAVEDLVQACVKARDYCKLRRWRRPPCSPARCACAQLAAFGFAGCAGRASCGHWCRPRCSPARGGRASLLHSG